MLLVRPAEALGVLLLAAAASSLTAQPAPDNPVSQPLPDVREFLDHVRENLRSDGTLLADYTFTERSSEARLDSSGGVKKLKTSVYEVYPSEAPGKMYRRLIARDGKPLPPKDLAAQDKEQEDRAERRRLRLENETPADKEKRLAKEEAEKKKEREIVEELFRMDELVMEGREAIDGRSTIRVSFRPRPGYKPASDDARAIQKLAGRAWVDEQNYQLVKIEAELLDSVGVGPGGVIRLQKGAQAFFERRRINDEIWLPARARFFGAAKVLLFIVGRVEVRSEYGDYKKFSVSTSETVSAAQKSQD
jgi:hypothetical protein